MSSNENIQASAARPSDLASPAVSLKNFGPMFAAAEKLPLGHYELVVEYKVGPRRLADDGRQIGAVANVLGGLGLGSAKEEPAVRIEVEAPAKARKTAPASLRRFGR